MLDLISHFAVLDTLRVNLRDRVDSGAVTDTRVEDALTAVEDHYPYAAFGSVVDHLLAHDGTSDAEIGLLRAAATVYADAHSFVTDFRDVRQRFEALAQQPGVSADTYNDLRLSLAGLVDRWEPLVSSLQEYAWNRLQRPLDHLVRHPRADDRPVDAWPWRDVVLSRRTGAFAASLMRGARKAGTPEATAFGVGALAGYAGNAIGSPYLVRGTGGPRRSHPYRDRMAAYAVGAWFRNGLPGVPVGFPTVRYVPVFGPYTSPRLPDWLSTLLTQSLDDVYGGIGLPLPDLQGAYERLVEHWRLVNGFPPLPPAAPVADPLDLRIATTLTPQDIYRPPPPPGTGGTPGPGPGGGGGSIFDPGPGAPPWYMPAHENAWDYVKEACLDILTLPVFLIRVGFWIGHEASDSEPTPQPTSPAPPVTGVRQRLEVPLSQAQVDAVTGGKDVLIAVDLLSQMDQCLHRMTADCLRVMKVTGLLYPEPEELADPLFRQFLVAAPDGDLRWPARPQSDPDRYLRWPDTLEEPLRDASSCVNGAKPVAVLLDGYGGGPTVNREGVDLLVAELLEDSSSPVRVTNLDLDADRGLGEECWTPRAGTSVTDDPVVPERLGYDDL
ncbi:hypothetical protein [Streptomyces tagetis]|uniref:Uncharacterized protein n=1 Tax=Streptomyces tagetis TaxID=2820809 RepID=A0A941B772_9ACTN|nr:hypothetical protein [Streptomyces sp. RG38]MBQ0827143.1 hypothetical protein [Streptomyces sp. RG38]